MAAIYGSKDANNMILGPKYYNINGIWALLFGSLDPQGNIGVDTQAGPQTEPPE